MEAWGDRCPVIIVPTKYPNVPVSEFQNKGVSTVIWANHNMRGAIVAMREITQEIFDTNSLAGIENSGKVCPVSEVFRLQNTAELKEAEGKYDNPSVVLERMQAENQ